jgi:hypothetical protein
MLGSFRVQAACVPGIGGMFQVTVGGGVYLPLEVDIKCAV